MVILYYDRFDLFNNSHFKLLDTAQTQLELKRDVSVISSFFLPCHPTYLYDSQGEKAPYSASMRNHLINLGISGDDLSRSNSLLDLYAASTFEALPLDVLKTHLVVRVTCQFGPGTQVYWLTHETESGPII